MACKPHPRAKDGAILPDNDPKKCCSDERLTLISKFHKHATAVDFWGDGMSQW